MRVNFNRCPDCGEQYGSYGMPRFERHSRVYSEDSIVTSRVRAVCDKCEWETKSHDNVKECAEEWNNTVIPTEDNVIKEDSDCKKLAERFAGEVMWEIFKREKTGKLLYLFVQYLSRMPKMYAYRGHIDDKYKFVVITEDEYKKLKDEQQNDGFKGR